MGDPLQSVEVYSFNKLKWVAAPPYQDSEAGRDARMRKPRRSGALRFGSEQFVQYQRKAPVLAEPPARCPLSQPCSGVLTSDPQKGTIRLANSRNKNSSRDSRRASESVIWDVRRTHGRIDNRMSQTVVRVQRNGATPAGPQVVVAPIWGLLLFGGVQIAPFRINHWFIHGS